MNSIITVTAHNHGECELDVSRVVALVPRRKELLFESTYWKLNDADFDRVSELWHKLKGGEQ